MMTLSNWNTLQDAAIWLTKHTGDEWSEKAVLARFSKSLPETITVALPRGVSLLKCDENSEWRETGPFNASFLLDVSGVELFIHELEISGDSLPRGLVAQEGGVRFKCLSLLSLNDVRLTRSQIEALPTEFHRFREQFHCRYSPNVNDALEVSTQELHGLNGWDLSADKSNHNHQSEKQSTIHRLDDGEGKRNTANLLVEEIADELEKNNQKAAFSKVWLEIDKRVGKSIIYGRTEQGYLCNIGEEKPHHLTKGAVRGVLDRRNIAKRRAKRDSVKKNNHI